MSSASSLLFFLGWIWSHFYTPSLFGYCWRCFIVGLFPLPVPFPSLFWGWVFVDFYPLPRSATVGHVSPLVHHIFLFVLRLRVFGSPLFACHHDVLCLFPSLFWGWILVDLYTLIRSVPFSFLGWILVDLYPLVHSVTIGDVSPLICLLYLFPSLFLGLFFVDFYTPFSRLLLGTFPLGFSCFFYWFVCRFRVFGSLLAISSSVDPFSCHCDVLLLFL